MREERDGVSGRREKKEIVACVVGFCVVLIGKREEERKEKGKEKEKERGWKKRQEY